MRQRQDGPVPLVELLEAAAVDTPGALLDAITERGDGVLLDPLGRLAVPLPVAERLWAEQEERERIAAVEFERAEAVRLAKLEEHVKAEEVLQLEQARQLAARQRQQRIEQATGQPMWTLEREIIRSRTHEADSGMSLDQRQLEDDRPVSMAEVEEYIKANYGAEILERSDK